MAEVPSKYKITTEQQRERNFFPLRHRHLTTTDFFKIQPVVCRKVEPNDSFNVDVTSFCRMFPMPFPTFGRIKYYNRCFFVPYRQIMEGFTEFINDVDCNTSDGFVRIQSVPYFTNKDLADAYIASLTDYPSGDEPLCSQQTDMFFWRKDERNGSRYLVGQDGYLLTYPCTTEGYTNLILLFVINAGTEQIQGILASSSSINRYPFVGTGDAGTCDFSTSSGVVTIDVTDTRTTPDTEFQFVGTASGPRGNVITGDFTDLDVFEDFDNYRYDFKFGDNFYRFTNRGRYFYTVLCSLGYRIDFRNSAGAFINVRKRSAGRLLAFVKVFLDWYSPSAYSETNAMRVLFRGIYSSGKQLSYQQILTIAYGLDFAQYDRDYFTSAWSKPDAPNVSISDVDIPDITVENSFSGDYNLRSKITTRSASGRGSDNQTPTVVGETSGVVNNSYPKNFSYYALESLRALTNMVRRYQLSGNRAADRYLSKYGVHLDDDRVNRCYYIGGYSYDADIMDIMSTADTPEAALGDYAGKGIAYSDAHRSFKFDSGQEHGFIIVVSSVVPEVGYVQGISRENLQLSRLEFFNGDFDNLGTQPQLNEELFSDYGMPSPDGKIYSFVGAPDGVRGYVPRYMEEKIGEDYLTGDFNVPSRRVGMDAYHLFRLFNDPNIPSINKGFLIGEQKQYDRIFNNISDDYDHMYVEHYVYMKAYRKMKSAQEVYDFEHSDGSQTEVSANGTFVN